MRKNQIILVENGFGKTASHAPRTTLKKKISLVHVPVLLEKQSTRITSSRVAVIIFAMVSRFSLLASNASGKRHQDGHFYSTRTSSFMRAAESWIGHDMSDELCFCGDKAYLCLLLRFVCEM